MTRQPELSYLRTTALEPGHCAACGRLIFQGTEGNHMVLLRLAHAKDFTVLDSHTCGFICAQKRLAVHRQSQAH